jgi:glycerophosphoryl diester phosphodiesterase
MQKLIAAGVDGIITNYPDRLIELLRTTAPAKP